MLLSRTFAVIALAGLLVGCTPMKKMMHEMQPHRIQRWNRGPGMQTGSEAYFSVIDPIPTDRDRLEPDLSDFPE